MLANKHKQNVQREARTTETDANPSRSSTRCLSAIVMTDMELLEYKCHTRHVLTSTEPNMITKPMARNHTCKWHVAAVTAFGRVKKLLVMTITLPVSIAARNGGELAVMTGLLQ